MKVSYKDLLEKEVEKTKKLASDLDNVRKENRWFKRLVKAKLISKSKKV